SAVNGASTDQRPGIREQSSGDFRRLLIPDAGFLAVEGRTNKGIETEPVERNLHGAAIGGGADQPLPQKQIRHGGERSVAVEAPDRRQKAAEREAIAADTGEAGGRARDHDGLTDGLKPALLAGGCELG